MLGAALIVIAATAAWTLAHMIPFFYGMRALGLLRVAEEEELMGLDRSHHGGSAYDTDLGGVDKLSAKLAAGGMEGSRHDRILHRCATAPPPPGHARVRLYARVRTELIKYCCTGCLWHCLDLCPSQ